MHDYLLVIWLLVNFDMTEPFINEFSWSFSRHKNFKSCTRKYYYLYYGSWGGWNSDADELSRKLYQLKKMTNLPMLVGDVVHRTINYSLERLSRGKEVPVEDAKKRVIELFRQAWRESKNKAWQENASRNTNLFEHYYNEKVDDDRLLELKALMEDSITGFYDSDSYGFIKFISIPHWLTRETLESFDFQGTKIWVKLDFAARHDERIYIYDWKTGKQVKENDTQLAVYAMFAQDKWGINLDDLRLFDVYLSKRLPVKLKVSDIIIRNAKEEISKSIKAMRNLIEPGTDNAVPIEKCQPTDFTYLCKSCQFKEVCYPDTWSEL